MQRFAEHVYLLFKGGAQDWNHVPILYLYVGLQSAHHAVHWSGNVADLEIGACALIVSALDFHSWIRARDSMYFLALQFQLMIRLPIAYQSSQCGAEARAEKEATQAANNAVAAGVQAHVQAQVNQQFQPQQQQQQQRVY